MPTNRFYHTWFDQIRQLCPTASTRYMSLIKRLRERTRAPPYWRNLGLFTLGVGFAGALVVALWLAHAHTMSFVRPRRFPPQHTPAD